MLRIAYEIRNVEMIMLYFFCVNNNFRSFLKKNINFGKLIRRNKLNSYVKIREIKDKTKCTVFIFEH